MASPEKTAAKWRQTAHGETILLQNEVTAWSEREAFPQPSLLISLPLRHRGWHLPRVALALDSSVIKTSHSKRFMRDPAWSSLPPGLRSQPVVAVPLIRTLWCLAFTSGPGRWGVYMRHWPPLSSVKWGPSLAFPSEVNLPPLCGRTPSPDEGVPASFVPSSSQSTSKHEQDDAVRPPIMSFWPKEFPGAKRGGLSLRDNRIQRTIQMICHLLGLTSSLVPVPKIKEKPCPWHSDYLSIKNLPAQLPYPPLPSQGKGPSEKANPWVSAIVTHVGGFASLNEPPLPCPDPSLPPSRWTWAPGHSAWSGAHVLSHCTTYEAAQTICFQHRRSDSDHSYSHNATGLCKNLLALSTH